MNHIATRAIVPGDKGLRRLRSRTDRLGRFFRTLETWSRRQRSRRQLAAADFHILRDIGISEAERFIECNKPFWEE